MSLEDDLRLTFTPEQWLELEIQAAGADMSIRDYAKMLLKDAISEMREEQEPPKTTH